MRYRTMIQERRSRGAFSLTEVVLALAVFSLAIVSLLGLMSIAMSTQRDSVMETNAANVAASILNQRRSAPQATIENTILPKLSEMLGEDIKSAASGSEVVDGSGKRVAQSDPNGLFICEYKGWGWNDPVTPKLARVRLRLLWPVELARRAPERAESYEVFTMMRER